MSSCRGGENLHNENVTSRCHIYKYESRMYFRPKDKLVTRVRRVINDVLQYLWLKQSSSTVWNEYCTMRIEQFRIVITYTTVKCDEFLFSINTYNCAFCRLHYIRDREVFTKMIHASLTHHSVNDRYKLSIFTIHLPLR